MYNPAIFCDRASHPSIIKLAKEYLDIVNSLKTETAVSAQKAHLFKIFKPCLSRWPDLRERLGRGNDKEWKGIIEEFEKRIKSDEAYVEEEELSNVPQLDENGYRSVPFFYAQPYMRPVNVNEADLFDDKQDNGLSII